VKNIRLLAVSGIAASLAVGTAACSSTSSSTTPAAAPTSSSPIASSSSSAMASGAGSPASAMSDFGPGCSAVPKTGAGSFTGMATAPVATAASANPVLSTLVTAVKKAGLVDTLSGTGPFTVFAPTNEAFAKLPPGTVDSLLKPENKDKLVAVLTYHVVPGRMSAKDLMEAAKKAGGQAKIKTVEGDWLTVEAKGSTLNIWDSKGNVSKVTIQNVFQSNGVIQVIDTVLLPS